MLNRPASADVPAMIKLIDAGMSLARFNLSHGTAKVSQVKMGHPSFSLGSTWRKLLIPLK